MSAFLAVIRFELNFYFRRMSTWVYWLIFFGLTFLIMLLLGGAWPSASAAVGGTDGNVAVNSPYVLALIMTQQGLFAILVTAALAGHAGYRDFGEKIDPLVFTTPLPRWAWTLGRYTATLLINAVVLTEEKIPR